MMNRSVYKHLKPNIINKLANIELRKLTGNPIDPLKAYRHSNVIINEAREHKREDKEINKMMDRGDAWLDLYHDEIEYIKKGMYVEALNTRSIMQDLVIRQHAKGVKVTNSVLLVWCLIENGNNEEAIHVLDKLQNTSHMQVNKTKINLLKQMISGYVDDNFYKQIPKSYQLEIQGKDVIIIGPLGTETYLQRKNDIIIKINHVAKLKNHDSVRVDISFYNGEVMSKIDTGMVTLPQIDTYVFHRFQYPFQDSLILKNKARMTYRGDCIVGLGQPNMLPTVLQHVIAMNPRNIKLYGFNLYLSNKVYGDAYIDKTIKDSDINKIKKNFAVHNIISQYQYISFLYNRGYITADSVLSEIMEMGIRSYLSNMEELTRTG